jgi:hypothetical protein
MYHLGDGQRAHYRPQVHRNTLSPQRKNTNSVQGLNSELTFLSLCYKFCTYPLRSNVCMYAFNYWRMDGYS